MKGLAGYRPARRPDRPSLANCDTVAPATETVGNKTPMGEDLPRSDAGGLHCCWTAWTMARAAASGRSWASDVFGRYRDARLRQHSTTGVKSGRLSSDRGEYSSAGGLELGGIVRRFRQVALGGLQLQQFFLILVHKGLSSGLIVCSMVRLRVSA